MKYLLILPQIIKIIKKMKKYFYLFAMMLLTATAFTSCSDEGSTEDLIGQWRGVSYHEVLVSYDGDIEDEWEGDNKNELVVFKEGGTVEFYYKYSSGWDFEGFATYKYKDNKITITWDDDDYDVYKVATLTSDQLVLKEEDREDDYTCIYTETYRKVNIDLE